MNATPRRNVILCVLLSTLFLTLLPGCQSTSENSTKRRVTYQLDESNDQIAKVMEKYIKDFSKQYLELQSKSEVKISLAPPIRTGPLLIAELDDWSPQNATAQTMAFTMLREEEGQTPTCLALVASSQREFPNDGGKPSRRWNHLVYMININNGQLLGTAFLLGKEPMATDLQPEADLSVLGDSQNLHLDRIIPAISKASRLLREDKIEEVKRGLEELPASERGIEDFLEYWEGENGEKTPPEEKLSFELYSVDYNDLVFEDKKVRLTANKFRVFCKTDDGKFERMLHFLGNGELNAVDRIVNYETFEKDLEEILKPTNDKDKDVFEILALVENAYEVGVAEQSAWKLLFQIDDGKFGRPSAEQKEKIAKLKKLLEPRVMR